MTRKSHQLLLPVLLAGFLVPLALLRAGNSSAQVKPPTTPQALFRAIEAQDAALFDSYNRCDLQKFIGFFPEEVEFFHDHDGVILGRQKLAEGIKNNICGQVTRELVPGSLEVYPMDNYGALEIGRHRFHHPKDPKEQDGEGRFIHLWHYDNGTQTWTVTRVFSFDHHTANSKYFVAN